jgi:hypothetical protein
VEQNHMQVGTARIFLDDQLIGSAPLIVHYTKEPTVALCAKSWTLGRFGRVFGFMGHLLDRVCFLTDFDILLSTGRVDLHHFGPGASKTRYRSNMLHTEWTRTNR